MMSEMEHEIRRRDERARRARWGFDGTFQPTLERYTTEDFPKCHPDIRR